MGIILRYKILVKDLAIFEVLYNTGNSIEVIPFQEIKLQAGEKRMINNISEISKRPIFASVKTVPV